MRRQEITCKTALCKLSEYSSPYNRGAGPGSHAGEGAPSWKVIMAKNSTLVPLDT